MTLLLDLDETLVHCGVGQMPGADFSFKLQHDSRHYTVNVRTRPYLEEFLEFVSKNFEVVLFTASKSVYAQNLLNHLDPNGEYFQYGDSSNCSNFVQSSPL